MSRIVELPLTAKQRQFLDTVMNDTRVGTIGYGGARGPGKTYVHVLAHILRAIRGHNTTHLILRRVQRAADLNIGRTARLLFDALGLPLGTTRRGQVQWLEKPKQFAFPNGSLMQLGYCLTDNDWEQYQGVEYATVGFAEATQFPEAAWDKIGGSNRSNSPAIRGLRLLDCNPGGLGHGWVKRRIISDETRDRRTAWVPALLRESLATLEHDPGYALRVLRPLTRTLRQQWERGDWDVVEGAFWAIRDYTFQEVEVPYWATVYAGVDPGYFPSAYAVVWVAKWNDEDGQPHMHVMRELKAHRLNLGEQARESLKIEHTLDMPVSTRYSDPAAWQRLNSDRPGAVNTASTWAKHDWHVASAPKSPRADGWALLRMLMDDGVLTISPRCQGLKTEMLSAIHKLDSDDMPDSAEDHLQDSLRYIAVSTMGSYASKARRRNFDFVPLRDRGYRERETMMTPAMLGDDSLVESVV